jgi:hypothetical protein
MGRGSSGWAGGFDTDAAFDQAAPSHHSLSACALPPKPVPARHGSWESGEGLR